MKSLALILLFFTSMVLAADQPSKSRLFFDALPVLELAKLYYTEIEHKNFVIDPKAQQIADKVTVSFDAKEPKQYRALFLSVLAMSGLEVETQNGTDYLRLSTKAATPTEPNEIFVYRPKFRDITYFSDLLSSLFPKGRFTFQRAVQASTTASPGQAPIQDGGNSAYSQINKHHDLLIFSGPAQEVSQLRGLIQQIDLPEAQVQISAVVYEFSTVDTNSWGVGALLKLFDGKLKVSLGMSPAAATGNVMTLATGSLDLVASLVSTDTRFRVISRPHVRVKDAAAARFMSGDDVPVLGAAVLDKNGNPIQSVEYKSSGVILDVAPNIRDEIVDLAITQQISNFAATKTGVSASPTLIKREIKTNLLAKPGEVYVIGGLTSAKSTTEKSHLPFFSLPLGEGKDLNQTEILVLLQVDRV